MAHSPAGLRAAARARSAAVRADEIQARMVRLRSGAGTTSADLVRAQAAATSQLGHLAHAVERLQLQQKKLAGKIEHVSLRERPAAQRDHRRADPRPTEASAATAARLEEALVAMLSPRGLAGLEGRRRRALRMLVERCRDEGWQGWTHAACLAAAGLLPTVSGTAVSLAVGQAQPLRLASSDEWTHDLEELHCVLGEGPAVLAREKNVAVLVRDTALEDPRWPTFTSAAAEAGVRSVWAFPIAFGRVAAGSITCYRVTAAAAEAEEWLDAEALAEVISLVLLADLRAVEDGSHTSSVEHEQINMAAGMLSVQLAIPVQEAMVRIRAHAFAHGSRLRDVANEIVERRLALS